MENNLSVLWFDLKRFAFDPVYLFVRTRIQMNWRCSCQKALSWALATRSCRSLWWGVSIKRLPRMPMWSWVVIVWNIRLFWLPLESHFADVTDNVMTRCAGAGLLAHGLARDSRQHLTVRSVQLPADLVWQSPCFTTVCHQRTYWDNVIVIVISSGGLEIFMKHPITFMPIPWGLLRILMGLSFPWWRWWWSRY